MRCYNGAPDYELKAVMNDRESARKEIEGRGFHPTYFPMEGAWMAFDTSHKSVSGFHPSLRTLAIFLRTLHGN